MLSLLVRNSEHKKYIIIYAKIAMYEKLLISIAFVYMN